MYDPRERVHREAAWVRSWSGPPSTKRGGLTAMVYGDNGKDSQGSGSGVVKHENAHHIRGKVDMIKRMRELSKISAAALAAAVVVGVASTVASAGGETPTAEPQGFIMDVVIKVEEDLMPTSLVPNAVGEASLRFKRDNDGIEVKTGAKAEGLVADHEVALCVNQLMFDHGMTDDQGSISLSGVAAVKQEFDNQLVRVRIRAGVDCEGNTLLFGNAFRL